MVGFHVDVVWFSVWLEETICQVECDIEVIYIYILNKAGPFAIFCDICGYYEIPLSFLFF